MKRIHLCSLLIIASLLGCTVDQPEPTAFVALASNAKAGGMKITAIDGNPVSETDGHYVPPGKHEFRVACQLDNGVGTTFAFEAELIPDHSYCFFSRDQGKSCTIIYTRVSWAGNGLVLCK